MSYFSIYTVEATILAFSMPIMFNCKTYFIVILSFHSIDFSLNFQILTPAKHEIGLIRTKVGH